MLDTISQARLFSFADVGRSGWPADVARLRWPCRYEAYEPLGAALRDSLSGLPCAYADHARGPDVFGDEADKAAAMWLALAMALPTLSQSLRYVVELTAAAAAGVLWRANATEMPLLAWLSGEIDGPPTFLERRWQRQRTPGAVAGAKRGVKNALTLARLEWPGSRTTMRQVTASLLLDHYRAVGADNAARPIVVGFPTLGLDGFPPERELRIDVRDQARAWATAMLARVGGCDGRLAERIRTLAHHVLSSTVSTAWRDMARTMRKMPRRRLGALLCSGTPSHAGRVLGWWYRRHGLPAYRFAHGGDRALYLDPGWDVAELVFCSRYFGHGRLERDNLAARLSDGEIGAGFPEQPAFDTLGSPKHQRIYDTGRGRPRRKEGGKRLLYVAGLYGNESMALSPVFKTPDHLYVEWQYWLLAALARRGYEVTVKMHPAGLVAGAKVLGHTPVKRIGGHLDANQADYDCLLFDFPGSAWFESLASQAAVACVDLGCRRLDPRSAGRVRRRCPIVAAHQDERNLLRVDLDGLDAAIGEAQKRAGCDDTLAQLLFQPQAAAECGDKRAVMNS